MSADRPTQSYEFGWWDGRVYHYAARKAGERYYGLGERTGAMDRAGRRFRLTNVDPMGYDAEISDPLYKSIPFLLIADADGACHGAFYDTMSDVTFDLGCELDNYHGWYRYMVAQGGDLDLYMIAGPDPAAVTRRFTWLTGEPALMPRWALGYSGSTMSYTDQPDAQARLAGFVAKLEQHDIGCGSFHLSSGYTSRGNKRYVFNWNRDKFPDPAGFVQSYRAAGVEVVPNIKPALLRDHPEDLPPEYRRWIEIGYGLSAMDVWADQVIRTEIYDAIEAVLQNHDLLVTPTLACMPVKNATDGNTLGPAQINGEEVDPSIGWCLTYLTNFSGHPSASIPAGLVDGLPVGMQIIGRRGADVDVLAASAAFERVRPWTDAYRLCENRRL